VALGWIATGVIYVVLLRGGGGQAGKGALAGIVASAARRYIG
jgi:hypothetical protein